MKKDLITIIAKCLLQDSLTMAQINLAKDLTESDLILDHDLSCEEARSVLTWLKSELRRCDSQNTIQNIIEKRQRGKSRLSETTSIVAYERGHFVLRRSNNQKFFICKNNAYHEISESFAKRIYRKAKNKIISENACFNN